MCSVMAGYHSRLCTQSGRGRGDGGGPGRGDGGGLGRGDVDGPGGDGGGPGRVGVGWAVSILGVQPRATAMMPITIAVAPVSRRASPPSPSSLRPSTTPNSTLISRAGATALTEVKLIATRTRM
jgi:hypothetical protein